VTGNEKPPPTRQPPSVGDDEVLHDSRGRIIDDAYIEGAVEDALSTTSTDDL
jgi:hypothetical protein